MIIGFIQKQDVQEMYQMIDFLEQDIWEIYQIIDFFWEVFFFIIYII
jgi:hypothetical protein